jgi:putative DNA primase/helicase
MSLNPKIMGAEHETRLAAKVELEQRIIGWQLKGAPGAIEAAAEQLRCDIAGFESPYGLVQAELLDAFDCGRAITAASIAAVVGPKLTGCDFDLTEHLRDIAYSAPAVISVGEGREQMHASIGALHHLRANSPKPGDLRTRRGDAIEPIPIDWIWPGWLAARKFHLLAGNPGAGKTTLSLSIAATITSGGVFPDGTRPVAGSVLFWTGEDDLADTIMPRFLASGGNGKKIHFIDGIHEGNGEYREFDPAYDISAMLAAASTFPDLKLLILDPVVSAVAGDSHKNSETRRGLMDLVTFASKSNAAVLGITHLNKNSLGKAPWERVTGSHAFVGVSRMAMIAAKASDSNDARRLVRAKANNSRDDGGFEYHLIREPLGGRNDLWAQTVQWGEALEGSCTDLLMEIEATETPEKATQKDIVCQWLREVLGTGQVRASYIQELAEQKGHSWTTVKRASETLRIEKTKIGSGGWVWKMPDGSTPSQSEMIH